MTRESKALLVIVGTALGLSAAAFLEWRHQRFVDVAARISPCDSEEDLRRKTAELGPPRRERREASWRELSWTRGGDVLSVLLVERPATGELVVGVVSVVPDRATDDARTRPPPAYEDAAGLRNCK